VGWWLWRRKGQKKERKARKGDKKRCARKYLKEEKEKEGGKGEPKAEDPAGCRGALVGTMMDEGESDGAIGGGGGEKWWGRRSPKGRVEIEEIKRKKGGSNAENRRFRENIGKEKN